jgi:uncharacterized membrane protein
VCSRRVWCVAVKLPGMERVGRLLDRLRSGFWFIPGTMVVSSAILAVVLIAVDRSLQDDFTHRWIYGGGPDNASDTLTTIASSMITFTALVFSITMVALQLTSSQFSPRVVRNFLRDRRAQIALGVFVSTFAYAFMALSAVRVSSDDDPGFVPTITVTVSLILLAASVVAFVDLIHHMSQSLQVATIIDRVAAETRDAIDRLHPPDGEPAGVAPSGSPIASIVAPRAGVITDVDIDALARCAADHDVIAVVPHAVGTFICSGMPLVELHAAGPAPRTGDDDDWTTHVRQAGERTMRQDVLFGFRQLVDVAERALSPGTNDPTTAIQCLDRIHDLLRGLAGRPMPLWRTVDGGAEGQPRRAYVSAPGFPETIELALDEIRHWGSGSPRVHRRITTLLDDLDTVTTGPASRAAIARQRDLLDARRDDLPAAEHVVADPTGRDGAARFIEALRSPPGEP